MKVLIDIPDDDFTSIRCEGLYYIGHDRLAESVTTAFQQGRIIPAGHSDLIDRSALQDQIHSSCYSDEFCIEHNIDRSINLNIVDMAICNAPAIVTADKENKECTDMN